MLGNVLPYRCVLVASPAKKPEVGDIAVWPVADNLIKLVSLSQDKAGKMYANTQMPQEATELTAAELEKMHKVVLIAMP
jgi:hypothetical protein